MRIYRGSAKNRGFGHETSENFVKISPIFTQNEEKSRNSVQNRRFLSLPFSTLRKCWTANSSNRRWWSWVKSLDEVLAAVSWHWWGLKSLHLLVHCRHVLDTKVALKLHCDPCWCYKCYQQHDKRHCPAQHANNMPWNVHVPHKYLPTLLPTAMVLKSVQMKVAPRVTMQVCLFTPATQYPFDRTTVQKYLSCSGLVCWWFSIRWQTYKATWMVELSQHKRPNYGLLP